MFWIMDLSTNFVRILLMCYISYMVYYYALQPIICHLVKVNECHFLENTIFGKILKYTRIFKLSSTSYLLLFEFISLFEFIFISHHKSIVLQSTTPFGVSVFTCSLYKPFCILTTLSKTFLPSLLKT